MAELGRFEYDNLIAGGVAPKVTDAVTLVEGQLYLRGSVLGLTDTGEATLVDSSLEGTESKPYAVLSEDVDATEGSTRGPVYLTGEFNKNAVIFGGEDTAETHEVELRNIGIFLKTNQEA